MKKICLPALCLFFFFSALQLHAQPATDLAVTVQLHATVQAQPAEIHLQWEPHPNATGYSVYRKTPGGGTWGFPLASLAATDTAWTDTNVMPGIRYQYRVQRAGSGASGNGYLLSGIEVDLNPNPGRLLVVVDTSVMPLSNPEFLLYLEDVEREGWVTRVVEVNRDSSAIWTKRRIVAAYQEDPGRTRAAVLIGHVAVPYSGNFYPDGHGPGQGNHQGAWPADPYYADMDSTWTDLFVNETGGNDSRNHNVPGDGKFDQSSIPGDNVELELGRIDMAGLSTFSETETQLLERYFRKNHAFRARDFVPVYRGLVENNFGGFSEGFGQNGLRNFTSMFGPDSVYYVDYDNLQSSSYLWSYACGAGSYSSAGGISNHNDMASDSLQAVFTMHFGSYFGDWDHLSRNYLRAALGSGTVLTNCWAARPNWWFYPMALGETIGHCTELSMNNVNTLHVPGFFNRGVHMGLMGDPTLRMYVTESATGLTLNETSAGIEVAWTAPVQPVDGYYLFYKPGGQDTFTQVGGLIAGTQYTFPCPLQGVNYTFRLHAVELTTTASGSFYNLSPGLIDSLQVMNNFWPVAGFNHSQGADTIYFSSTSTNFDSLSWDFGDGNGASGAMPSHVYAAVGMYTVTLVAHNACGTDTFVQTISVLVGIEEAMAEWELYPNPAREWVKIRNVVGDWAYEIRDLRGRLVRQGVVAENGAVQVGALVAGIYLLEARQGERRRVWKVVVRRE